jgi:hypothetical protein
MWASYEIAVRLVSVRGIEDNISTGFRCSCLGVTNEIKVQLQDHKTDRPYSENRLSKLRKPRGESFQRIREGLCGAESYRCLDYEAKAHAAFAPRFAR